VDLELQVKEMMVAMLQMVVQIGQPLEVAELQQQVEILQEDQE
jgi:hypothetical protein